MKNKILLSILLIAFNFSFAQAQGTVGGAVSLIVKKVPHLRDLYDHCIWQRLSTLENSESVKMLSALEKSHWLFAQMMKSELNHLKVCVTPNGLVPINVNGNSSFRIYRAPKGLTGKAHQVAIRILNTEYVFLDKIEYDLLSASEQAELLNHETIHSFIPETYENSDRINAEDRIFSRNDQVRSLSNLIASNDPLHPYSTDEFILNLEMNGVNFKAEIPSELEAPEFVIAFEQIAEAGRSASKRDYRKLYSSLQVLNQELTSHEYLPQGYLKFDFNHALQFIFEDAKKFILKNNIEKLAELVKNGIPTDSRLGINLLDLALENKLDEQIKLLSQNLSSNLSYEKAFLYFLNQFPDPGNLPSLLEKAFPISENAALLILKSGKANLIRQMLNHQNSISIETRIHLLERIIDHAALTSNWIIPSLLGLEQELNRNYLGLNLLKKSLLTQNLIAWKSLLTQSFDLNRLDTQNSEPLLMTLTFAYIDDLTLDLSFLNTLLARRDLEVNIQNGKGETAFTLAMKAKRFDLATLFIQHQRFDQKQINTYLQSSTYLQIKDLLKVFVQSELPSLVEITLQAQHFDKLFLMNLVDQVNLTSRNPKLLSLLNAAMNAKGN